jgi:radical SAM superfamily enzyme YgiQ (UPF0313 family)
LGLAYIAAYLKKNGYSPIIRDFNVEPGFDNLKNALKGYDVIGISFLTSMLPEALMIAKAGHDIGAKIVMGGPHATALPHDLLKNGYVDIVVRKEGELTTLDLLKAFEGKKELDDVKGISFRKNSRIMDTPDREYIENIDSMPFPARELLKNLEYKILYPGFDPEKPITAMMTSRGCPSKCIFCASNIVFGRKPRYRSPKNIVDEIEEIVNRFGINQINISDDTFTLRPKFVIETCDEIIRRKIDVKWACSTRVPNVSLEMLSKMKEAGCTRVGFGIESGSPKILKNIKKGIKVEQAERALKITEEAGLTPIAYFITGNPGEDYETIWETVEFLYRNRRYLPHSSLGQFVAPYPGTEVLDIAKSKNHLRTEDWSLYLHSRKPLIRTEALDYDELTALFLIARVHLGLKKARSLSDVLNTMALFVFNLELREKRFRDLFKLWFFIKTSIKYYGGYKRWSAFRKEGSSTS